MLTSLFGDLSPQRLPAATDASRDLADHGTATIAHRTEDVVVEGCAADAMRLHFAAHRHDLQQASQRITLLDPSRLWASQMVHALADAAGQAVQRINLRDRATLRTLAVIERALVPRRGAEALRVYHADLRDGAMASGPLHDEITAALAEGSHLTAVLVGAMQPQALVSLLRCLLQATRQPAWRCPHLVFIVPPGAAALRQRILEQPWPPQVRASTLAEPLASTASAWNCVLEAWETTQGAGADYPPAAARRPGPAQPEHRLPAPAHRTPALMQTIDGLLLPMSRCEGVLACGIVDLARGDLLASRHRDEPPTDLAALALALCAARQAHQAVTGGDLRPDEILVTAGPRQSLLRRLPGELALGFVAVLDRQQANLALLRFKLMHAERAFA